MTGPATAASGAGASGPRASEAWAFDFVSGDGSLGGFVRLARVGERCWYWCYLVGAPVGLVAVRDHEVPPPRRPAVLEIRADALWAELVCETLGEHWTLGLEAFGVRLDAPIDACTTEIGERVAVGLDLEWEVGEPEVGEPAWSGSVRGDVLLERDRLAIDGWGSFVHETQPATWPSAWTGWCRFDDGRWASVTGGTGVVGDDGIARPASLAFDDGSERRCRARGVVPVPLEPGSRSAPRRGPALVRVLTDVLPAIGAGDARSGVRGTGWVQVLQSWGR